MRHEFVEEKSTKTKINKPRRRAGPAKNFQPKETAKSAIEKHAHDTEVAEKRRYYNEDRPESDNSNGNIPKRAKLGKLPSYIPL